METGLGVWADLVMDAVEVGVLGAVLWQLFNLSHDMGAMLRVVRRMGRKTTDTTTSTYLHQGEADRAGNRERNAAPLPARIEDLFIEQAAVFGVIGEITPKPTNWQRFLCRGRAAT